MVSKRSSRNVPGCFVAFVKERPRRFVNFGRERSAAVAARRGTLRFSPAMSTALSRQRRWASPQPGDTLASVAGRELSQLAAADALKQISSWNLHLIIRPLPGLPPGSLLGSDVVYLEPPLAARA